jgi:TPR repeat protein
LLGVAASEGHAISNYMLGTMAEDEEDLETAVSHYRKAASLGLGGGHYSLFLLYFQEKLPKDDEKAREHLMKAVEGDDLQACLHLASLIYDGVPGYPGDLATVERLLLKAADGGHPEAMKQIGEMYYFGFNFPHEPAKGIEYLQNAVAAGNQEASKVLQEISKQKEDPTTPKTTKRKRKSERERE